MTEPPADRPTPGEVTLVGQSLPMVRLREQLRDLAGVRATVLLRGETGTGKSLAARAMHAWGPRASAPFVVMDCAGLSADAADARLVGTDRRPGCVEEAGRGTLLLDEIGDLSPEVQGRVLRLLENDAPAPCRIVASSQRDLNAAVAAGTFRRDLYFRLNVISLRLPPLRDRAQDVALLVAHLAERFAAAHGRPVPTWDRFAVEAASHYPWPGNVRELANLVERAVVLGGRSILPSSRPSIPPPEGKSLPLLPAHLQEEEVRLLRLAWEQTGGNQSEMARVLGIERSALRYKLQKYQIV